MFAEEPLDPSLFKLYPGSEKGPNPEDDKEHYARWFLENHPKEFYQGRSMPNLKEMGIKQKFIQMTADQT